METTDLETAEFQRQLEQELTGNILPFWSTYPVDAANGGFFGALTNDRRVLNEVPRSAVLCARILWTFSAAYRHFGVEDYRKTALWAYDYLTSVFWDADYGGLYWQVDATGHPVSDRKHCYAQAFGIYGLAEYYQATRDPRSQSQAITLFKLLEEHAFDPVYGGYIEGCDRKWGPLEDMRLSARDVDCRKSMNTLLHILEAYTNLSRVWEDRRLEDQHRALLGHFLSKIVDLDHGHLRLFFNDDWHSLVDQVSYGHDIEASWLLLEAAERHADPLLLDPVRAAALKLAEAVYREGRDADGSLVYEADPQGWKDTGKAWWVQAEAMVGFTNAYQLSGQAHYARAARQLWEYTQAHLVDREHGDWFKQLSRDGTPNGSTYKVGPWECPYHHSRACFEMLERLDHPAEQ
jgi:mannobiose 2-epimerase